MREADGIFVAPQKRQRNVGVRVSSPRVNKGMLRGDADCPYLRAGYGHGACETRGICHRLRRFDLCYNFHIMTQPQATAEVFWTAFQAMKASEREVFIGKLMKDKKLAEDLRYAAVIEKRKNEPTVSLDDYRSQRSTKK